MGLKVLALEETEWSLGDGQKPPGLLSWLQRAPVVLIAGDWAAVTCLWAGCGTMVVTRHIPWLLLLHPCVQ